MKGWITVDPSQVIEVVNRFGRLKVLDDKELVVEVEKAEDIQNLQRALREAFESEVDAEAIPKK
jgi:phosphopantetheine adenylyltransferase